MRGLFGQGTSCPLRFKDPFLQIYAKFLTWQWKCTRKVNFRCSRSNLTSRTDGKTPVSTSSPKISGSQWPACQKQKLPRLPTPAPPPPRPFWTACLLLLLAKSGGLRLGQYITYTYYIYIYIRMGVSFFDSLFGVVVKGKTTNFQGAYFETTLGVAMIERGTQQKSSARLWLSVKLTQRRHLQTQYKLYVLPSLGYAL